MRAFFIGIYGLKKTTFIKTFYLKAHPFVNHYPDEGANDHSEKETTWISGACIEGDGPERDCLLGMIEGKRARGRLRMKYMDGIKDGGKREVGQEYEGVALHCRQRHLTRHCGIGISLAVCVM